MLNSFYFFIVPILIAGFFVGFKFLKIKLTTPNPSLAGGEKVPQEQFPEKYTEALENFDVKTAFEEIFKLVGEADEYMQTNEPFKVVKVDVEKGKEMLENGKSLIEQINKDVVKELK